MTEASDKQIEALRPKDAKGLAEYRRVLGAALRVMINDDLPKPEEVEAKEVGDRQEHDGVIFAALPPGPQGHGRAGPGRRPAAGRTSTARSWCGSIRPARRACSRTASWSPRPRQILDRKGAGILAVDVFGTGELSLDKPPAVNANFAGFTFGYNRPLLAQRVHDILTAVAYAQRP